jgi:hypothetical protein
MAEETNENIDSEIDDTDQAEDLENESEELEEEGSEALTEEKNKQLFARAKKAEDELKKLKAQSATPVKLNEKPADTDIDKLLDEKLEKRELDDLDLGDELRKDVESYSKVNGVSIKKALKSDYIKFQLDKAEKEAKLEGASLGGKNKSKAKKDPSDIKPIELDLATPEGKADLEVWGDDIAKKLG